MSLTISVLGEDSLAAATAICCARHFTVYSELTPKADLVWVCYDTPIIDDVPDAEAVLRKVAWVVANTKAETPILISSQLPVGSTARLEKAFPSHTFIHSPENIRVATAVKDFENQPRIVVGVRTAAYNFLLTELLSPFTKNILFTDPETAEFSKHALNNWLGLNIAFANELGKVAKVVGANMDTVTDALRTDARISPKAPLKAGSPYGGGHLARDIFTVNRLAQEHNLTLPIISNIKRSNET